MPSAPFPRLPIPAACSQAPCDVAHVVTAWNPLSLADREARSVVPGRTIAEVAPATPLPFVAVLNGEPVLRAQWSRPLAAGDHVVFAVLPQGGGDGGSDPLRTVLQIALVVAVAAYAPTLAPEVAAAFGTSNATALALTQAGLLFAGSALLQAVIPAPRLPAALQQGEIAAASPTYSVATSGNSARLDQPIPVIYGRQRIFPDYAAQPYYLYSDGDQYLHALYCIGQGQYAVEQVTIDDTAIDYFADVQYEIVAPGGTSTLVAANIVTSPEVSGQTMLTGEWIGPFAACGPQLTASSIGVDIVMPRGLFWANTDGSLASKSASWRVEWRAIDDYGDPVGDWAGQTETYSAATTTPQRLSYSYTVTAARYQVRIRREDTRDDNARAGHDLAWASVRASVVQSSTDTSSATFLAVRIRASEQLSGLSSRKIAATVTRKLPSWSSSSGWAAATATRSIAWAFADALRSSEYGAGLADGRIDLAQLATLDALWTGRGDAFDGIFDARITIYEALRQIARAGRAVPIVRGGVYTCVRDTAQSVPVCLYGMRNIVRGSLSVRYLTPTEETPDQVVVEYFDGYAWDWRQKTATVPGVTSPSRPVVVRLFGVSSPPQAQREALYIAANSRYRRRMITLSTEMDGFLPAYGDLVAISHDLPAWGSSGEVVAWDALTLTATLSEPVTFGTGAYYIALQRPDGSTSGPYAVTAGSGDTQVVLASLPDFAPATDLSSEPTRYAFGASSAYWQLARVLSVTPRGPERVELLCAAEDDRVHTADAAYLPTRTGATTGAYTSDAAASFDAATDAERSVNCYYTNQSGLLGQSLEPGYVYAD